ncbi:hypothetical protein BSFA1_79360 (plasmid) [Burkholderia sp. SFA1]|nr:hypothetical protein BSFA1_79360 [Burkholderia sp. SFA1]
MCVKTMVRRVARDHRNIGVCENRVVGGKAKASVRFFEVSRRVVQVRKMSDFQSRLLEMKMATRRQPMDVECATRARSKGRLGTERVANFHQCLAKEVLATPLRFVSDVRMVLA